MNLSAAPNPFSRQPLPPSALQALGEQAMRRVNNSRLKPLDGSPFYRRGVFRLYHMTHIDNLASILCHGLLSHNDAHAAGVVQRDIANQDVVERRALRQDAIHGRCINDYTPLYFNPKNPMLGAVQKRDGTFDEIVMLCFAPQDMFALGAIFTDGNAAALKTRFFSAPDDLDKLDYAALFGINWLLRPEGKRKRCAEVLVPTPLEPGSILSVVCRTPARAAQVRSMLTSLPSLRTGTKVDPELYF